MMLWYFIGGELYIYLVMDVYLKLYFNNKYHTL